MVRNMPVFEASLPSADPIHTLTPTLGLRRCPDHGGASPGRHGLCAVAELGMKLKLKRRCGKYPPTHTHTRRARCHHSRTGRGEWCAVPRDERLSRVRSTLHRSQPVVLCLIPAAKHR